MIEELDLKDHREINGKEYAISTISNTSCDAYEYETCIFGARNGKLLARYVWKLNSAMYGVPETFFRQCYKTIEEARREHEKLLSAEFAENDDGMLELVGRPA